HLYRGDSEQYNFNVVGIGREPGSLVASSPGKGLSTGLILSQYTELQDGQYLLAGDRNTANSWVTDGLPSGVLRRWSRDWFLSPTGGLADAWLTFDFDDAGLAYSAGVEYDVLYRADTTGAFERLNLTGTFDNNQLAFVVGDGLLGEGTYTLAMVPEPGSLLLLAMALGAVLLMRV
ncbi:MAG: PEP-CTERM sorting domain-containing protein, partial [Patescibacteria group bacterium]|nr:PEP-CTERM sorting domain-containing protein [Patescibacteria group bacterium]